MKCLGGCGNTLTDPVSVQRRYGPFCYRKTFGAGPRLVPIPVPVRDEYCAEPPLFDLPDGQPAAPAPTASERRHTRIAEAVRRGYHPLGVALRVNIPLHADAAPLDDRKAPGLRCGTCAHRVIPLRDVAGKYPKCNHTSSGRPW